MVSSTRRAGGLEAYLKGRLPIVGGGGDGHGHTYVTRRAGECAGKRFGIASAKGEKSLYQRAAEGPRGQQQGQAQQEPREAARKLALAPSRNVGFF